MSKSKKSKKVKKTRIKTPLSFVDKAIYITIILFFFFLMVGMAFISIRTIPMNVAYGDGTVVACESFAFLLFLPIVLLIGFLPIMLAINGIEEKQPIFGNKRYKPSFTERQIKTVPLLSKEFLSSLTDSTKRKVKKTAITVLVIFVVFAALVPFGIYPRTVLDKNNNCITYNTFNKVTHKCNIKDADKLIIDISRNGGKNTYYDAELTFVFDDKSYSFREVNFEKMTSEERLNYMLNIKSMFEDDRYEITNVDRMDKLLKDNHYSEKEIELVYELFDYTE